MKKPDAWFKNFLDAIMAIQPADAEFIAVWHELKAGDGYPWHHHPRANEWVLIRGGVCQIFLAGQAIREHDLRKNLRVHVFSFPAGMKHTIRAVTDITYLVLRDRDDTTVCDK